MLLRKPNNWIEMFQYWVFVWGLKLSDLRNGTASAQLDLGVISKYAFIKTRDRLEIQLRGGGSVP
jgi:hypothetical protein